jgi:two-component system chemotaxis response regulator CheY
MPACLIVDDSKIVRKLARRMIEPLGFTIEEAEHGEDALKKCGTAMPDFILLDRYMPVMDGLEFIKRLRAGPGGGTPKVIFCTTESNPSHILEALSAGANEYVMKPFDEGILKDKMTQVGLLGG